MLARALFAVAFVAATAAAVRRAHTVYRRRTVAATHESTQQPDEVRRYWTEERINQARQNMRRTAAASPEGAPGTK